MKLENEEISAPVENNRNPLTIVKPEMPTLTPEIDQVIIRALSSNYKKVLVSSYGIKITRTDIETLTERRWLNDQVINFYFEMIVERSWKNDNLPKVYAFSSFFYPKLIKCNYSKVERWTRKVDLFSHDLIFIPVHLCVHWCLAVVDFRKCGIYYYNSKRLANYECLNAIEQFLKDEHLAKKNVPLDLSNFEKLNVKDIPEQTNNYDCGMFICKFAEYISRNAVITFKEDDLQFFRRRMVYEIVEKTILHS